MTVTGTTDAPTNDKSVNAAINAFMKYSCGWDKPRD
jgi:hypothetical protein